MNAAIETYINDAMKVLNRASKDEDGLNTEYKGYISSLGASINMSGLVPTLAFYTSKENSAKADRWKVLEWILKILKQKEVYKTIPDDNRLFDYVRNASPGLQRKMERDILDISVALKLCIRTFELKKS